MGSPLLWAAAAFATPATRVTVSVGLEPTPVVSTSFESTVGSGGLVAHAGAGSAFVLVAGALEANAGLRLVARDGLVRPDIGLRVGVGGAAAIHFAAWGHAHADLLGGVRIGRDTALDLRAGPMVIVGWLGADRPFPGLVVQAGVSIPFGPDPKAYEAGGAALAERFRQGDADPIALANAEVADRRHTHQVLASRAQSDRTLRDDRRAARDALYEAIEARDQLREERRSRR